MAREVNPFVMIEPLGPREEGDFGVYPVPSDTPEPDADPKESAPPVEEDSQEAPRPAESDLASPANVLPNLPPPPSLDSSSNPKTGS